MHADERQWLIDGRTRRDGRVGVSWLADELGVTPETIRRDLTRLERLGRLRRVHGGAIPTGQPGLGLALENRESRMSAEKDKIAERALDELPTSGSIIIGAGTTTARFASYLPVDREFTVVTNALDVAVASARQSNLDVQVVGGRVHPHDAGGRRHPGPR